MWSEFTVKEKSIPVLVLSCKNETKVNWCIVSSHLSLWHHSKLSVLLSSVFFVPTDLVIWPTCDDTHCLKCRGVLCFCRVTSSELDVPGISQLENLSMEVFRVFIWEFSTTGDLFVSQFVTHSVKVFTCYFTSENEVGVLVHMRSRLIKFMDYPMIFSLLGIWTLYVVNFCCCSLLLILTPAV